MVLHLHHTSTPALTIVTDVLPLIFSIRLVFPELAHITGHGVARIALSRADANQSFHHVMALQLCLGEEPLVHRDQC